VTILKEISKITAKWSTPTLPEPRTSDRYTRWYLTLVTGTVRMPLYGGSDIMIDILLEPIPEVDDAMLSLAVRAERTVVA
jgi:hypothetical protein